MLIELNPQNPDSRLVREIVGELRKGRLIIFPTDSVYAIGCDVRNKKALADLAKFKDVKLQKARFSIICSDLSEVSEYVKQIDRSMFRLLKQNLPGPFTFILEATNEVSKLFDASRKEIGIRIPDNHIIEALVRELGNPIATTSLHDGEDEIADYFADPYAIYERYDDLVETIIDGGYGNLHPTTIIDLTSGAVEIVRQGLGELKE